MPGLRLNSIFKYLILLLITSNFVFASPLNPSLSVLKSKPEFTFGTKMIGANYNGADALPSSSTTLWTLDFAYPFQLKKLINRKGGFSISLEAPYGSLRSLKAYDTNDFYPVRYGHTDSQFQARFGLGLEAIPDTLYFGGGIQFFLSGAGNSEATLATANPTGRMALDVGLNSSLYSGVFFKRERTSVSLLYRQEMNPEFVQKFDAKAPIGGENTFHQPLTAKSHLYFEPHQFDLEGTYDLGDFVLRAGAAYQMWSRYSHPVLIAETVDSRGNISSTTPPNTQMRDTWNPTIGVDVPITESLLALSRYRYQPTSVVSYSTVGNPLDNTAHVVSLGVSQLVKEDDFFPFTFDWSVVVEQNFFESKVVSQYTIGGTAYSYGARLAIHL